MILLERERKSMTFSKFKEKRVSFGLSHRKLDFFFRHKITQNLRYFPNIFCLGKNQHFSFSIANLRLIEIVVFFFFISSTGCPQTENFVGIGNHLLFCRQNLLLEEMLFLTQGDEGASRCQKEADLKETERCAVDSCYHCYLHVRLRPSSHLQGNTGLRSVTPPTLLQGTLYLLPLPRSPGRRLHRGTLQIQSAPHSRLGRAWYHSARCPWVEFTSEVQL